MKDKLKKTLVAELVAGKRSFYDLSEEWEETERAGLRLEAVSKMVDKPDLRRRIRKNGVINAAAGRNAEQMIGEVTVPLAVVGPLRLRSGQVLRLQHEGAVSDYWVPLATTEGALVASVQRGVRVIGLAGGAEWVAEDRGMTRAPVFKVADIGEGKRVKDWLVAERQKIGAVAEKTSNHLKLLGVEPEQVGRSLWVRLRFETGEAMGMNMVTVATQKVVELMEEELGIGCLALSGNGCVDKKAAWSNVILGRGIKVQAEVVVKREWVKEKLKTTPEAIVETVKRKMWLGSAVSGSMGHNGHFANIVAAMYLATGQDMAHVVEGSQGITTAELEGKDLYFSVNLPNLVVGTIGGGTHLPVQKAALEMMGLGQGRKGEKLELGRILAGTVLAGELSLTAALAAGHLAQAHQRLGRSQIYGN